MQTGLTDSPRTDTASPTAKTLRAALMSRSWIDTWFSFAAALRIYVESLYEHQQCLHVVWPFVC
ncbi:hypothetical protein [Nitrosomonas cryotolerans]|uniref:hypothetical protein n=1 Tax=Nitrosomonas cryotolerans TaxID=44575 RepID=UPI0015BFA4BA|nr:hypothetical protein [Nitrosomonas cryotolerans]